MRPQPWKRVATFASECLLRYSTLRSVLVRWARGRSSARSPCACQMPIVSRAQRARRVAALATCSFDGGVGADTLLDVSDLSTRLGSQAERARERRHGDYRPAVHDSRLVTAGPLAAHRASSLPTVSWPASCRVRRTAMPTGRWSQVGDAGDAPKNCGTRRRRSRRLQQKDTQSQVLLLGYERPRSKATWRDQVSKTTL